jgi:membrane protein implicated in regulation of membrane protease activity
MNFYVLILIFIATTAILVFTLRPALKFIVKIPENKNSDTNLIGKEAMVFKPITETELGTIKVFDFDAVLLAKSLIGEFIGQGTTVKIIQQDGDIAIVECLK